ncbi:MAG: hypothetical protein EOR05_20170 [Mesorhizobium sp.]|nr:MAG: hypothetical protein EOR05_20170 [Mesorhizobium sp.]
MSAKRSILAGSCCVKRTIRARYACRACKGAIVQMPAPAHLIVGGMATTALAAHVAVSKFAWQLPFNRQAQILAGHSITLNRGTLGSRVARVAWWLKPLYDPLLAFIRSQPRISCHETSLARFDPGRKRTKLCPLDLGYRGASWAGPGPARPSDTSSPRAVAPARSPGRWAPLALCCK